MKRTTWLVLVLAMVVAACGGGGDDAADDGGAEPADAGGGGGDVDGFVTVAGETYEFSYDTGVCGQATDGGRVFSQGFTDDGRQVVFSYGLAEDTPTGEAVLQVIVYDAEVQQQWYSAVGWGGGDVGSVSSLSKSGNTVSASGQLQEAGGTTLADFTAEATCDQ